MESVYIINKNTDEKKVRLSVRKNVEEGRFSAAFVSKAMTLYDIARDIACIPRGKVIMEADFGYILDNIPQVPDRFKKNNRGYKKAVFALLNQMAFHSKFLDEYPFCEEVSELGLTPDVCKIIYWTVVKKGFYFRADVYRMAIRNLKQGLRTGKAYKLLPGQYYTGLEKELMERLQTDMGGVIQTGEEDPLGLKGAGIRARDIGFLKADEIFEQYTGIRAHIIKLIREEGYEFSDFAIVFSDSESLRNGTACMVNAGFPVVSSVSVNQPDNTLELLSLIRSTLDGNTRYLVDYYNRTHNSEAERLAYEADFEFPEIGKLITLLEKRDEELRERGRYIPKALLHFLNVLRGVRQEKCTPESLLKKVSDISDRLGIKGDRRVFEYRDSVAQVFGESLDFGDGIDYLKEILLPRKKSAFTRDNCGVVMAMMEEYIPKCRIVYFVDMEEHQFLKDRVSNNLLSDESHETFNRLVYGCTKEEHLRNIFASILPKASDRIFFVVPSYSEATIPTHYLEYIYALFPKKEYSVKVLGSSIPDFRAELPFCIDDIAYENVPVEDKCPPASEEEKNRNFSVTFKGNVRERLGSATSIEKFISCPAKAAYESHQPRPHVQEQEHFDKGHAFHYFMEKVLEQKKIFVPEYKNLDQLRNFISNYIKRDCSVSGDEYEIVTAFDSLDVRGIFGRICERYPDLELTDRDLFSYLFFLCRFMEELDRMGADPESFMTEYEIEGIELPLVPGLKIRNTRPDFVCRSTVGDILIFDFKSGSISDYKEDIRSYSLVQLPIYGAVLREKFGNHPVTAAYVSFNGDYKYVDGCGDESWERYYEKMACELNRLLKDADNGIFLPKTNRNCDYCPLSDSCYELKKNYRPEESICREDQEPYCGYKRVGSAVKEKGKKTLPEKKLIMFTGEKGTAVSDLKRDIAVVAGAGAGKTELLSSRYVNLIVNGGCSIDEILCITFTEKATGEMQKRIFRKICETLDINAFYSVESECYTLTPEQRKRLLEAKRSFFSKNRISTNHSFCRNMILRFEKLKRDSVRDIEATVVEDFMIKEKKKEVLDTLIDRYREKSENFRLWSRFMSRRSLRDEILVLIEKIKLSGTPLREESREKFRTSFESAAMQAREASEKLHDEILAKGEKFAGILESYLALGTCRRKSDIIKKIEKLRAGENLSDTGTSQLYKECPEALVLLMEYKKLHKRVKPVPAGKFPESFERDIRLDIFDLAVEADRAIEQYKAEKSWLELSDFPLCMTELLENGEIRKQISSEIKYIMVDEFQDSNWLQKKILDYIHTPENPLFIVGDEKQAIYRFQQCDNQIFESYKRKKGTKIVSLDENYRSVDNIVRFCNTYFSCNSHAAFDIVDNPMIPVRREENPVPRVHIVNICFSRDDESETVRKRDLTRWLKINEGNYIANLIKENGRENYGSWGILIRSYTNVGFILEALGKAGIPYSFIMKRDFFKLPEISELILMLKVIYGILPVSALAANPLLAELYSRSRDMGKGLLFNLQEIVSSREYSLHMGMTPDAYYYVSVFLKFMGELADKYDENPESIFIHLDRMSEENTKDCAISVDNSVKIMTVHSAKGLEFDNLILAKVTEKDPHDRDEISFVNICRDQQLFTDFCIKKVKGLYRENSEFPVSAWMNDINTDFDDREHANLLYVALTRARNNLFVTLQTESCREDGVHIADVNWNKNIMSNMDAQKIGEYSDFEQIHMSAVTEPENPEAAAGEIMPFIREEGFSDILEYESVSRYLNAESDEEEAKAEYTGGENRDNRSNDIGTAVHDWFERKILEIKWDVVNTDSIDTKMLDIPVDVRKKAEVFIRKGLENREYRELVRNAAGLRAETGIFFRHDGRLLYGIMDLVLGDGKEFIVLDYKTHTGGELDKETFDRYSRQVRLYADGLAELYPGMPIRKMLLVMPTEGDAVLREVL